MAGKRIGQGYIQSTTVDDIAFNLQYQSYQRSGYAMDLASDRVIGSLDGYYAEQAGGNKRKKTDNKDSKAATLLAALTEYGSDEDEAAGPWAPVKEAAKPSLPAVTAIATATPVIQPEVEEEEADKTLHIHEPDEEAEKWEKVTERKMAFVMPPRPKRGSGIVEATSTFHGDKEVDYQGRSWALPPQGVRADGGEHDCFIPKKCTRRLTGHTKGVQCIEYFPGTGHLLLSGSMDGKAKVWDVASGYQLMRTYSGHTEGIRSMEMHPTTGRSFLTSGFDRLIRLWDTETGQATGTFSNRKMAYAVRHAPRDPAVFLAACSDNKVYQWDTRTGEVVQEYNYHLAPCNTVTFVDDGSKFVSTSDDKKVLVWEYGIPVPIKYVAEPGMHSIPSVSLHPSGAYIAGQSMNNTIVVYSAKGEKGVKQIKKRVFRGHNNTGYACQVGFSANGHFLLSGDGLGQLYVWDWKTTRVLRKFHAHDSGPCIGAQWHPLHPNMLATCGWDGLIKIWE